MKKFIIPMLLSSSMFLLPSDKIFADEIDNLKDQIEENKEAISNLEEKKSVVSMSINEIETAISKLKNEINSTKNEIYTTQEEISKLNLEIENKEIEIARLEKELLEKKEVIARNLKIMEQKKSVPFVEYLFTADDLNDLLSRFNNLKNVANANEEIYHDIRNKNEVVKKEKLELEVAKKSLSKKIQELQALELTLQSKEDAQEILLTEYEKQFAEIEAEINEQEQAINHINSQISSIIIQREAERKKREEEEALKKAEAEKNGQTYVLSEPIEVTGTGFIKPLSGGSYYVSSNFGWRIHPIYETKRLHAGIDLAAPVGTPIYAADAGTVLYSGPASGYGYWIVIDHNNGFFSIYAHMYSNQLYVGVGDQVQKGQHIAAVGSSGSSTGAHLHFEISRGGISSSNKIDPRIFIGF